MKEKKANKPKNTFEKTWNVVGKFESEPGAKEVVEKLLENRGLTTKKEREEFLDPTDPKEIPLSDIKVDEAPVKKAIKRIKKAIDNKERVIVYGDYDADGICATAILWEALYDLGVDALPHIPERFSEGYGLNSESIETLKEENENLGLIVTVDNGITAFEAVDKANEMGIDVILTDHHEPEEDGGPDALTTIHTQKIGGAGISWFFAREIRRELGDDADLEKGLDLAAIGTISDQIPLLFANRSLVKRGLEILNETERPGLNALMEESAAKKGEISTGTVGFMLAPRLNAMGRLEHAIDSLRLLCTTSSERAKKLSEKLGKTNRERQKLVEDTYTHARELAKETESGVILVSDGTYHEGVIGLVASRLVEEFYRPAIVVSQGEEVSKASARSIQGFNIIETIRELGDMLESHGGHPMAAGFSIQTTSLADFSQKLEEVSTPLLTEEVLKRGLRVDVEVPFSALTWELSDALFKFEPTGIGNPAPVFATKNVEVLDARVVGSDNKHLKLSVQKDGKNFDAIAFNMGKLSAYLKQGTKIDVAYNFEENLWNGQRSLQLKVKDINLKDGGN